jgi:hypothetical protein
VRPLAARGKTAAMPEAAIGTHFDVTPNIERNLFAEIAFDRAFIFEDLADVIDFLFRHIANFFLRIDPGAMQKTFRPGAADPVNVSESDFRPFFRWQVDARNTCHILLSLTLFMFWVDANHPHHAFAVDQLALVTDFFD